MQLGIDTRWEIEYHIPSCGTSLLIHKDRRWLNSNQLTAAPNHHIYPPTYCKPQNTITQAYESNIAGKHSNTYPNVVFILVDRQPNHNNFTQHKSTKTHKLTYQPLQSPHTRVCGKRKAQDKPNSIPPKKKYQTSQTQVSNNSHQ